MIAIAEPYYLFMSMPSSKSMEQMPPRETSSVHYMGSGYPSQDRNRQLAVGQVDDTQFRLFNLGGPR